MKNKRFKLWHAIFLILSSTMFISGTTFYILSHVNKVQKKRLFDDGYSIRVIVQTGSKKEALKTSYLAELMNLSVDKPTNIYQFDEHKAAQDLLKCPLIQQAKVKKIKPNSIYVDYEIREPKARVCDYENIAIDEKGYLFPMDPFITPKKLPEIYLNIPKRSDEDFFSRPVEDKKIDLAFEIIDLLFSNELHISIYPKRIDVSKAFLESYGKREIVLFLEEEIIIEKNNRKAICLFPKYLRLCTNNYLKQLSNYLSLHEKMIEDYRKQFVFEKDTPEKLVFLPKTIDMRISKLAFIDDK